MSGKRLLDAAALYRATRGVVSKHLALRTRQSEAYKKTSSLAKALATRTHGITLTKNAASTLGGRIQSSSSGYSTQPSSEDPRKQVPQVLGRESVQPPESPPIEKHGLQQDHSYERSKQKNTAQLPPDHVTHIQQGSAKRYPLPDGFIPPAESKLAASTQPVNPYCRSQRTEPIEPPLTENTEHPGEDLKPSSTSGQNRIPDPSKGSSFLYSGNARILQRQAEKQIPLQAAEAPLATASDVKAARNNQQETTEPGIDQNQDVFYTPSPEVGQVLSALPRVKLPKNTVDEQHSVESVPDRHTNPDVFYSSRPNRQEQAAIPDNQAIPKQDEPSEDMYSELFHSPKVAKILKGNPKPADTSWGLNLEGVNQTPIEDDRSAPVGNPENFNTRRTIIPQRDIKVPGPQENSTLSKSSREDDIQTLAADIAKDASQENGRALADKSDVPPTARFDMHESRVPSSRFGRMWQYGGLATSMAFGAVGESFRRVTGSSQTSGSSLMLSASNMERLVAKLSRMRGAALKLGQMMSFQGIGFRA
ncbi:MAG: hypothetical protein Q9216_002209 [Gyalolechia sp. 2 TL-2023]